MKQLELFQKTRPGRPKKQKTKSGKLRQIEKRKRDIQNGYTEIGVKVKISSKEKIALLAKKHHKTRGEIIDLLMENSAF